MLAACTHASFCWPVVPCGTGHPLPVSPLLVTLVPSTTAKPIRSRCNTISLFSLEYLQPRHRCPRKRQDRLQASNQTPGIILAIQKECAMNELPLRSKPETTLLCNNQVNRCKHSVQSLLLLDTRTVSDV